MAKNRRVGAPTGIPRVKKEDMIDESAINFVFDVRRQRDVVKLLHPSDLEPINDVAAPWTGSLVRKW